MGLFDVFRNEFIDIIEWNDDSHDTLLWRFPRHDNEIKMGAMLTVRESQQAVFINEGVVADVFQPGLHKLQTQNMPILSTLMGWKYNFESPFKAEVYFVSTKQFIDQRWGTKNPIIISDARFGMIELRAFGTFSYRVTDAAKFIKEISGTNSDFSVEDINGQLRSLIVNKFSSASGSGNITVDKFAASLEEVSTFCQDKLNLDFENYGLKVTRFIIENVSMPDGLKEEIFEYSRLNRVDMQQLGAFKAAKSIEISAQNTNGAAGLGMGLGMSLGMGNVMAGTLGNALGNITNPSPNQNNATPPPLPGAALVYVALEGRQAGPFTKDELQAHIQSGKLQRNTLVWKKGLPQWVEAVLLPEVQELFTNMPPPLPPIPVVA